MAYQSISVDNHGDDHEAGHHRPDNSGSGGFFLQKHQRLLRGALAVLALIAPSASLLVCEPLLPQAPSDVHHIMFGM